MGALFQRETLPWAVKSLLPVHGFPHHGSLKSNLAPRVSGNQAFGRRSQDAPGADGPFLGWDNPCSCLRGRVGRRFRWPLPYLVIHGMADGYLHAYLLLDALLSLWALTSEYG